MAYFLRFIAFMMGFFCYSFRHKRKSSDPVRCLFVGYSGANNTGAEARISEAAKQLRKKFGNKLDITVASIDRKNSLRYFEEDSHLKVVQISAIFIFSVLKLLLRSDVVVLIEGYCFMEGFSQVLFWLFMYVADIAQRLGLSTVAYAVDAGSLGKVNSKWAKKIANNLDLLLLRAESAYERLKKYGVTKKSFITTDTAFTIEPASSGFVNETFSNREINKPIIGIAFEEFYWWPVLPSLWKFITSDKKDHFKSIYYHTWNEARRVKSEMMKKIIARFADWASENFDADIAFIAMDRVNIKPCKDVMNMMSRRSVLFDSDQFNHNELAAVIGSLKFLVTSEYHALIFAMKSSVPAIGLGHDERIYSLMHEIGLQEEYYIHYDEGEIENKLVRKSQLLMLEEEVVKSRLNEFTPLYLKRAKSNVDLFTEFLREKFSVGIN